MLVQHMTEGKLYLIILILSLVPVFLPICAATDQIQTLSSGLDYCNGTLSSLSSLVSLYSLHFNSLDYSSLSATFIIYTPSIAQWLILPIADMSSVLPANQKYLSSIQYLPATKGNVCIYIILFNPHTNPVK